jgi:hypothetical protein
MALTAAGGLAVGALAWRLEQGPLEVPWLAERAAAAFNSQGGRTRIEIESAELAWSGWRSGHRSPLDLRLRQVRAVDTDGHVRAELPDAAVSVSLSWLLTGVVAPRAIELGGLRLRVVRDAEGGVALDLGSLTEGEAEAPAAAGQAPAGDAVLEVLAELMRPPSEATPLAALRLVRISEARLEVEDAQLGRAWAAEVANLALTRRAGGGIEVAGTGHLALAAERVPLRIGGALDGATGHGTLSVGLSAQRPAALARAAPVLSPLAALDAPVSLVLDVRLQGLAVPGLALARLRAGAGALDLGRAGRVAIGSLEADVTLDERTLRIERAVLHPAPPVAAGVARAPVIRARAEAREEGGSWQAEASLTLDRVPMAELAHYWPAGIAPNARRWVTQNITEGVARDGRWTLRAEGDMQGALRVTALDGEVIGEELTVHWLRPMPPAEDAAGRVRFALDGITIALEGGTQSGTSIAVRQGELRFDLAAAPERLEMDLDLAGPLADVWALLRHPRLNLFRERPPPIAEITGTLREGRLSLALPLLADIPNEALRVRATGRAADVRIPRLVLGQTLERGAFDFAVDTEGIRTSGTASVLGVPLRIQQEADFRPGQPGQVVAREVVTGRADARQIAAFGLDPRPFVQGPVGLEIRNETRRNGQGRVALRADLREAVLAVEPLAWTKRAGVAANGEAVFVLQNGQLTAINDIRIQAPDALVRARGTEVQRSIPRRVEIQQATLGQSRFAGELMPPAQAGQGWTIALRGPALDLAPVLSRPAEAAPDAAREAAGEDGPTRLDARFERVLLGPDRALTGMTASATVDGAGVVRAAQVQARLAGGGAVQASIAAEGARRRLRLTSEDGGALLRAFGVLRTIQGGRLSVDAAWPSLRPGAPLAGTAELEEFAVREAPAVGKLLQAMSVYGVFEALSGEGLGFASLTAPFTLTREALVLEDARAFSASLGITARGRIDRLRETIDMEGTIVPAYVFNSLLGRIPGLGRVFSPERGGGVFAATYRMRGALADPSVSVNPLAALTPGFLRGIFGIGQADPTLAAPEGGR